VNDYREKLLLENMETIKDIVGKLTYKIRIGKDNFEDYLQEAYLEIYKKADKYNPDMQFVNFAYPVIKNRLIDLHRNDKERNLKKVYLNDTVSDDDESTGCELVDMMISSNDTENEVLKKMTEDMVWEYISKVKGKGRAKITVKGFEALELKIAGYSGKEIAKMFGVPSNFVRSWMSKAKKKLKEDSNFAGLLKEF